MSANLQKLELYRDFIIDRPVIHNHDWEGEVVIIAVNEDGTIVGTSALREDAISDYQMRGDGSIEVILNKGEGMGDTYFVDTAKNTDVAQVDLLLYEAPDSKLTKFPTTRIKNLEFTREEPLWNVTLELPNVLIFPAPMPF
jgi:hypothetical protein